MLYTLKFVLTSKLTFLVFTLGHDINKLYNYIDVLFLPQFLLLITSVEIETCFVQRSEDLLYIQISTSSILFVFLIPIVAKY